MARNKLYTWPALLRGAVAVLFVALSTSQAENVTSQDSTVSGNAVVTDTASASGDSAKAVNTSAPGATNVMNAVSDTTIGQPVGSANDSMTTPAAQASVAEQAPVAASTPEKTVKTKKTSDDYTGFGIIATLGTTIWQAGVVKSFHEYVHSGVPLALRGMFTFISYKGEFEADLSDDMPMRITPEGRLSSIDILFDVHPFTNTFRLTTGAIINLTEVTATMAPTKGQSVGAIEIRPEDMGSIDISLTLHRVAPYIGLGTGATFFKVVSFQSELGLVYNGAPQVKVKATGLVAPSAENESSLQKVFNKHNVLHWYPRLSFGLAVRLVQ